MNRLYLRLSVTDRCNFHCAYCMPGVAPAPTGACEPIGFQEAAGIVSALNRAVPIYKLRFTGGEPLLRAGLPGFIGDIRAILPRAELCLTTNGSLLARAAAGLKAAGLDRINVSLDSVDPKRFESLTGGGSLAAVLEGVRAAGSAGFAPIRFNAVLLRSFNGDCLAEMVRAVAREGGTLRFIELMKFGPGARLFPTEFLPADEAHARLSRAFGDGTDDGTEGTTRYVAFRDGARVHRVGFIASVSHPFCADCDRLRLDSRGRLFPCLREGGGVDCAAAMRDGTIDGTIGGLIAGKQPPADRWTERRMSAIGG